MSKKKPLLEAIYPLSPLQQGMLFHALHDPGSGLYVSQFAWTIQGALDAAVFEQVWRQLVARHAVLRTAFFWEQHDEPLQVVHQSVKLPFVQHDWRELTPARQQSQLAQLCAEDLARGFVLTKAPAMRLLLVRLAADTYQFIWTHHHILLDGWSLPLVMDELTRIYSALAQGQPLDLPPPRPYQDYISWLQRQDRARAELFWRQALAGITAPTALAIDRPARQAAADDRGFSSQYLYLAPAVSAALQRLARLHGLTLNTIVQAAWAMLLSRYSGEDDVVFGTTVSGRPAELHGMETMVGLFINTLPVRVRVAPDAALLPWLQQLQTQLVELRQYEWSALVQIQGWSDVPRGLPLFESIVVFESSPANSGPPVAGAQSGLAVQSTSSVERTNYALTLSVAAGAPLSIQLIYAAQRFDAAAIARLLDHLRTLLSSFVEQPQRCLGQLPMLPPSERTLLQSWNATAAAAPAERCIHELIADQATRTPDAPAVIFQDQQLSYGELHRRSNQLAHYLRARGVGPERVVGLHVARSPELIIALLGILKAGGAYLPLDPSYPPERLRLMLQDARPVVLLTQQRLGLDRAAQAMPVVCIDADWPLIARESPRSTRGGVVPDQLAYVIYTSGSTGQPKGVLVTHRALTHYIDAACEQFAITQNDRVLQFASIGFDTAAEEIFTSLSRGATLVLRDETLLSAAPAFLSACHALGLTVLDLPTAYWHQLTDEIAAQGLQLPPALRLVIIGGEQALPECVRRWRRPAGEQVRLVNTYGPTEATIVTTWCDLSGQDDAAPRDVPIGRPIRNAQTYVLDARLQPVPIGVPGELYIGGAGLARGYHNRPDLTAERFIPDPFGHEDFGLPIVDVGLGEPQPPIQHPKSKIQNGSRLYKTGDRARWRPDGQIEFLGRRDEQVKLRGYRIELGEIEAALRGHPRVREAAVVLREGDEQLVAYVVPHTAAAGHPAPDAPLVVPSAPGELRQFLQQRLPAYMLPGAIVPLDGLPLLPNGKLDRRALVALAGAAPLRQRAYREPRDTLELRLVAIWEACFGLRPIGVTDNFFELGGHSLLAVRLMALVRQQLGLAVPLATLFQGPTIEELAVVLRQQAGQPSPTALVPIQPQGSRRPLFLVHPGGGHTLCYIYLAHHLGLDQPCYGLQSQGLEDDQPPLTTIEEMAAAYIAAIQTVQPHGPYAIGGFSLGGVIAFEMAQQLQRQGQQIALLAVLDAAPPDGLGGAPDESAVLQEMLGPENMPLPAETFRQLDRDAQVQCVLEVAHRTGVVPPGTGQQQVLRFVQVWRANSLALAHYRPRRYAGRITLLRTAPGSNTLPGTTPPQLDAAPTLGWDALSPLPVAVHVVPGDHAEILREPHVAALAEHVRGSLRESQPAASFATVADHPHPSKEESLDPQDPRGHVVSRS